MVQPAQPVVTVGLERAHTEFFGEGLGLAIAGVSLVDLRGLTMRRTVAEEPQGIGLVATFLVRTGKRQRTLGEGVRLFQMAELAIPRQMFQEILRLIAELGPQAPGTFKTILDFESVFDGRLTHEMERRFGKRDDAERG